VVFVNKDIIFIQSYKTSVFFNKIDNFEC
jgi:hypothetical protein